MARVKKIESVVVLAKHLMLKGAYVISNHAKLRQGERCFTIGDIKSIIDTGYHEKRKDEYKDEYKEEYADWNYAIRGKTLDNDQARICIAFAEEKHFVVITVIRLEV
ncbi:MAG: DUF4258 domain-containing protein [Verrucomicrobia bacterium]|nr:DUF4258 domain-containing protein [Verrucomicrobiota bacterium]